MLGFNGGLMGVRKVPAAGSASGLWFQNEQSVAKRAGIWPVTSGTAYRYWRFANFANTTLNADSLDLSEIELSDSSGVIYSITVTASFAWTSGTSAQLNDNAKSTAGRVLRQTWSTYQPTATLSFDLGSAKTVVSVRIWSLFTQPRFPASFDLQFSSDGTTYTTYSTVTVGTSFVDQGSSVFASAVVTV